MVPEHPEERKLRELDWMPAGGGSPAGWVNKQDAGPVGQAKQGRPADPMGSLAME